MARKLNGDKLMTKRSTSQRGYGSNHQARRRQWQPRVREGIVDCARCGQRIQPHEAWDLGHTDDRNEYQGPEHQDCNRSAGGRNGAAVTNGKRSMIVREW